MTDHTTIVIFGASGDLALKKTFPSLYELYLSSLLPANTLIVGYARSAMTDLEARGKWGNYLKAGTEVDRAAFLKLCVYRSGGYGDNAAFSKVCVCVCVCGDARVLGNIYTNEAHWNNTGVSKQRQR